MRESSAYLRVPDEDATVAMILDARLSRSHWHISQRSRRLWANSHSVKPRIIRRLVRLSTTTGPQASGGYHDGP